MIGIPFYVWDLSSQFHEAVVEDFVAKSEPASYDKARVRQRMTSR